jgi:CheY-like chemotaxis protein
MFTAIDYLALTFAMLGTSFIATELLIRLRRPDDLPPSGWGPLTPRPALVVPSPDDAVGLEEAEVQGPEEDEPSQDVTAPLAEEKLRAAHAAGISEGLGGLPSQRSVGTRRWTKPSSGAMKGRVLVVDDDRSMCEMLEVGLVARGFETKWTTSAAEALESLVAADVDAVVTDLNMRGVSGLQLCERVVASCPDVPVIVITAFGSAETAIAATRAGASDFITKPLDVDTLAVALTRAVELRTLRES